MVYIKGDFNEQHPPLYVFNHSMDISHQLTDLILNTHYLPYPSIVTPIFKLMVTST